MHRAHHELDATAIQPYVAQIRTSMDRVRSVKTKLTAIDNAAGDIRSDVESLRSEVLTALESVETLLKRTTVAQVTPEGTVVSEAWSGRWLRRSESTPVRRSESGPPEGPTFYVF